MMSGRRGPGFECCKRTHIHNPHFSRDFLMSDPSNADQGMTHPVSGTSPFHRKLRNLLANTRSLGGRLGPAWVALGREAQSTYVKPNEQL